MKKHSDEIDRKTQQEAIMRYISRIQEANQFSISPEATRLITASVVTEFRRSST